MRVPLALYRLTPPPGWTYDDLIDEWNEKAAIYQYVAGMSRPAAEVRALEEVMAMCAEGTP